MRAILFYICIKSLVSAGQNLGLYGNLQVQVGSSCLKNPNFNISSFDINPWPPLSNINLSVNMSGNFITNVYVNQCYFE